MHLTNFISSCFESFAHYSFPERVQYWINRGYVWLFGIDMSEFDTLESYESLNALFMRSLIKEREFDLLKTRLIAPCDSLVMAYGRCENNQSLQIKGMPYEVSELVGEALEGDYDFINFYLSPKDYHRFHAPLDCEVIGIWFIDGMLLPVHARSLQKNVNLFLKNKRVVLKCLDTFGNIFYFVAVGALNVGKISLHFCPEIATLKQSQHFVPKEVIKLQKGDEIGSFQMGSTVVLLTQHWAYEPSLAHVCFGQSIASYKGVAND